MFPVKLPEVHIFVDYSAETTTVVEETTTQPLTTAADVTTPTDDTTSPADVTTSAADDMTSGPDVTVGATTASSVQCRPFPTWLDVRLVEGEVIAVGGEVRYECISGYAFNNRDDYKTSQCSADDGAWSPGFKSCYGECLVTI